MGPLRGDGNTSLNTLVATVISREDGSPSWGRKHWEVVYIVKFVIVEKMGPLRGDGNNKKKNVKMSLNE